jgi:hypothetical protein
MDKQQIFLANNIFDIDSALDSLEERLFTSSEEKSPISTEPLSQQQKTDVCLQQQHKESQEENGNVVALSDCGVESTVDDKKGEICDSRPSSPSKLVFRVADETSDDFDDSRTADDNTTTIDDVIRSEVFENGMGTQTISAASFSVDDKSSDSLETSSSSETEDSSNEEARQTLENPSTMTTSQLENDDSSKQLLISEDSTNPREEPDDQPVTTDLTLTKTVELTEYDPDPEPEIVEEPPPPAEPKKKFEIPHPIEIMLERPIEDFKEMSLNNFESTMDDISDNELESLEQELEELEDLVGVEFEGSSELKTGENNDEAVETFEESVKKKFESMVFGAIPITNEVETPTAVIEVIPEPVEAVLAASEAPQVEFEPPAVLEVEAVQDPVEEAPVEVQETEEEQRESSVSEAHEAIEPAEQVATPVDPDPALSSSTDESTSIQNLPSQSNEDFSINESVSTGSLTSAPDLGRVPPYWIPDESTNQCMQCDVKFSLIKRRHHCRACGLLLCASCCGEKFFLHYLGTEGRVCISCHETLVKASQQQPSQPRNPNPANPMEYCSTLPPQQQVSAGSIQPPTVMVPSGVLKRGPRTTERKSVIFSDGIRPGTDLDETATGAPSRTPEKPPKFNMPTINEKTNSFIPEATNELPPVLLKEVEFSFVDNNLPLLQRLRQEELKFAINKNFFVTVKIVTREFGGGSECLDR